EVEHNVCSARFRADQGPDVLCCVFVGQNCFTCTGLGSELESLRLHVDRENLGSRSGCQYLNGHMSKSTDTDDNASCARNQHIAAELDRMVGCKPRICQRSCLSYVEITDRNQARCWNGDIVCHAPITGDADPAAGRNDAALVLASLEASRAATAADDPVNCHGLTFFPAGHTRSHGFDPAGVFMT